MEKTLIVKIKPNTTGKARWYYGSLHGNRNLSYRVVKVKDCGDEPIFKNCYRYDNGSLFIDKEDCEIMEALNAR